MLQLFTEVVAMHADTLTPIKCTEKQNAVKGTSSY